jgi:biotin carboxyl carrier protein
LETRRIASSATARTRSAIVRQQAQPRPRWQAVDRWWFKRDATISIIDLRSKEWRFKLAGPEAFGDASAAAGGQIKAPMAGRVIAVLVEPGAGITSGQALLVVEAMKMEHSLRAPRDGIASLACKVGDQVEEGRELVVLEF